VAAKGCDVFIIHARKAFLQGLSPAENRDIPPLRWEVAAKLKRDFPHLTIVLNGGIKTPAQAQEAIKTTDGAMIGREAYQNPYMLALMAEDIFGDTVHTRAEIAERMFPYIERMMAKGVPLKDITRHMLGLYHGQPRARKWRQILSAEAHKDGASIDVVREALDMTA